ncbi:sulfurtransferase [Actinophytocola xinjiangensis]|uniref:Sulfurtransferase n=1 Tax=Actinophytocola xinjiangensis TaxID=485602 RepID=A0A7Z1AZT5_9PSEU|nr:rhodanese-like domain-containing protein [Actinophytocola xinjiangensis]OLF12295.1 sulfurtransferase [Actinophytocola xinjiangensis]
MNVQGLLATARAELDRVYVHDAVTLQRRGALLVDIRPYHNRLAEGEIPGALVIERIVLEWRLDPDGPDRVPEVSADDQVIVFCNEGYASSLAARDLRSLGLPLATDLIGGFRAWKQAGLPVIRGGSLAIT